MSLQSFHLGRINGIKAVNDVVNPVDLIVERSARRLVVHSAADTRPNVTTLQNDVGVLSVCGLNAAKPRSVREAAEHKFAVRDASAVQHLMVIITLYVNHPAIGG